MKAVLGPAFTTVGLALLLGLLTMATARPVSGAFDGIVRLKNDTARSGARPTFAMLTGTTDDASGVEQFAVAADTQKPTLADAFSGVGYDSAGQSLTFNDPRKLLVVFDDNASDLDPASIQTFDFQVSNPARSVIAADWFDAPAVTSSVAGLSSVVIRRSVFMTLSSDLAAGDTPNVKIIGDGVADEAGNTQDTGEKNAKDRIAPTITVSNINPALAGKDATVTFGIAADEPLDVTPAVVITNLGIGFTLGRSLVATGTNAWEVTTSALSTNGTYSIFVNVQDPAANVSTAGVPGSATSIFDAPGFVGFEADIALSRPAVTPADGSSLVLGGPVSVAIDFTSTTDPGGWPEDDEYFGDTHGTVTLNTATLDGNDILSSLSTSDNKKFLASIAGVAAGSHTIIGSAMDEAGNSTNFSSTFTASIKVPGGDPWRLAVLAALLSGGLAILLSGRVRCTAT